tara:strand:- start:108 stop:509 length:402 start_codon:yes stop_codon:yes gene_type:complete
MKKTAAILFFIFGITTLSNGQMSIEEQVADTVCVCLSKLDTAQIKANANAIKMQCLNEAITKNQTAIQKTYASEQRREEDTEKMGIQGSLYITLQRELIKSCPIYALFEKEIQTFREASKAGASMQKENGGSK